MCDLCNVHLVIASFSKTVVPRSLGFSFVSANHDEVSLVHSLMTPEVSCLQVSHTTALDSVNHASCST